MYNYKVSISNNQKSCILYEYLGQETEACDIELDIQHNRELIQQHHFNFDFIYGPSAKQEFVYENTAKSAVLSVLEVLLI